MKLIAGLGNPGKEYEKTRHNAGFMFVDAFLLSAGIELNWKEKENYLFIKSQELVLIKPQTFMNNSGEAISSVCNFFKITPENMLIVHDDLDLKLGEFKLQQGKGPRVHNGITSVEKHMGTIDFWRLRIGIENRTNKNIAGKDFVLGRFGDEEIAILTETFNRAIAEITR